MVKKIEKPKREYFKQKYSLDDLRKAYAINSDSSFLIKELNISGSTIAQKEGSLKRLIFELSQKDEKFYLFKKELSLKFGKSGLKISKSVLENPPPEGTRFSVRSEKDESGKYRITLTEI